MTDAQFAAEIGTNILEINAQKLLKKLTALDDLGVAERCYCTH